jgi:sigma-E factor negative regulatory protein RseA
MEQDRVIKVSMLLDDELNEEEALSLLEQIESDDSLKNKWFRYNTVSLALRSDSIVALEADLVDKVGQAIAREPAVVPAPGSTRKPSRIYNVFAGALAASVVIVAVIVVKQPADTGGDGSAMMVADKGVESSLQQAPAEAKSSEARFHGYLLNHNESAYSMGTLGMLPYARVVSYSAKQQ